MLQNPILLLILSSLIAAIPAAIWLIILFTKTNQSKKTISLVFGLGCLTAPALLGLQYVWDIFPRFNLAALIENGIQSQSSMYIAMFVLFGAMEEIIKMYVITAVDKKTVYIKTVNDTIRYSLAAALGFSFTENIYYLYEFSRSISFGDLATMYMFRSIFTASAHMIFSGLFGYYYAMGKFSIEITKQKKISHESSIITRIISILFAIPESQANQQKSVLKGLFLAIFLHATYNYILQLGYIFPVIIFVIVMAIYLWFLLKRKAGNLIINTDVSSIRKSKIAKKDEDVLIDLLSLWFQEERFVDVMHICERLLERDPDNKIVALFKAKALDKLDPQNPYVNILNTLFKSESDLDSNQKNILSNHLKEKEMFLKVQNLIKKQLKKEGKEFISTEKPKLVKDEVKDIKEEALENYNSSKKYLEKYTKGESFDIKL